MKTVIVFAILLMYSRWNDIFRTPKDPGCAA